MLLTPLIMSLFLILSAMLQTTEAAFAVKMNRHDAKAGQKARRSITPRPLERGVDAVIVERYDPHEPDGSLNRRDEQASNGATDNNAPPPTYDPEQVGLKNAQGLYYTVEVEVGDNKTKVPVYVSPSHSVKYT